MNAPSRYVHLDDARRRHGDRVDRFAPFFAVGDPLADAALDSMASLPRAAREALVERALAHGIGAVPEATDALRALFAQVDHVPFWVDFARADRGGRVFLQSGILGGLVLGAMSLVAGYCSPAGNKPLAFSGRLEADLLRRLAETSRFVEVVAAPGGMLRAGEGFRACVKVRLMHAAVRRMLVKSPKWDAAAWGAPINQVDASGTVLLFSRTMLEGLDKLGHVTTPAEKGDLMHLWRYAGWLLGVDPELLCATFEEAEALWDLLKSTQAPPDDDSRALARALMESGRIGARTDGERDSAEKRVAFGYALSRHLIGDEYADALGYPRSAWRFTFQAFRAVNAEAGGRLRAIGPFGDLAANLGKTYWRNVTAQALRGVPAAFAMPDSLRR